MENILNSQEKKTDAWKPRFDLVPIEYLERAKGYNITTSADGWMYFDLDENDIIQCLAFCMHVLGGYQNTRRELAKVYGFGATKYGDESWKTVPNGLIRYKAALDRHLDSFFRGDYINTEDGNLLHIAQVAFNCIAILYFMESTRKGIE